MTIIRLFVFESKRALKSLFTYVCIVMALFLSFSSASEVFVEPYDTEAAYYAKLGIPSYKELQEMSYEDFNNVVNNNFDSYGKLTLYKRNISMTDEAKYFTTLSDSKSEEAKEIFQEYVNLGYYYDIINLSFEEIKELSEQEYSEYMFSINAYSNQRANYFAQATENNYIDNRPDYETSLILSSQENMSSLIARGYYARLIMLFSIIMVFAMIFSFVGDYKTRSIKSLRLTTISGFGYVIGKGLFLFLFWICILFVCSLIPVILFFSRLTATIWVYQISDFIYYWLLLLFPSLFFVSMLTITLTLLLKDFIFSAIVSFFYIFVGLNSTGTLYDSGRQYVEELSWLVFYPSTKYALGITEVINIIPHQVVYFLLSIILLVFSILLWEIHRTRGGVNV